MLKCVLQVKDKTCVLMGWLQLVGSIKLQVSFAKETYRCIQIYIHIAYTDKTCARMGWLRSVGSILL